MSLLSRSTINTISIKWLLIFLLSVEFIPSIAYAQRDTIFLNQGVAPTKHRSQAKYYRFLGAPEFGRCKVEEFYFSGKKRSIFFVSAEDSSTYDGPFTLYNENGQKLFTGTYVNGTQIGIWKTYYTDTNVIWAIEEYIPYGGDTAVKLKSYYLDGKLKRVEYIGKNIDTGVCYNEEGQVIPFTPFQVAPKPDYDWQQYVAKHITYPVDARYEGMYGRVNVFFIVSKSGQISNVVALNDAESSLAKEAVRVVSSMPNWNPGIRDDEKVDAHFTLPVTYALKE